jgi:hypothetical protein
LFLSKLFFSEFLGNHFVFFSDLTQAFKIAYEQTSDINDGI